ncbi:MAG: glutamine-hydrolyzing GMP synthase [Pseudomonadota bacterium]|nr:glutamine-hydrolyzing GMP synthase [Pseudomonadota bacterium]
MHATYTYRILILDFGSQYTQLIARRVREAQVYCEIHAFDQDEHILKHFKPHGIIVSGSPESVHQESSLHFRIPESLLTLGVPILGICYGMQTLAFQLGGQVEASAVREFGYAQLRLQGSSALLHHIEDHVSAEGDALLDVWMSHGDRVKVLPPGFKVIASTAHAPIAAMADEQRQFYGVQFHPEVTHTPQGSRILQRFIYEICGCQPVWTTSHIIETQIDLIRQQVGTEQVVLGLSGGVDSSVVAALLHQAIDTQLTCIFVDNGLLRLHEAEQVMTTFGRHMGVRIIHVEAQHRFLTALAGITDPEQKRKIIGNLFIEIFEEQAQHFNAVSWLAQGTIYPDVIESAGSRTGKAQVIKSHHNVAGLPATMKLKLLEPLRELFKDEVRKLGIELGLPQEIVYRHPFPGPGLGVRILGAVTSEYADMLRQADAIFIEELRHHGWYDRVSQAFAVFLPVKSVGVRGDSRYYDYVISLRAVETVDFMTARWARLPYELLEILSHRIINEVNGISRVCYDISGKPPATIEWE